MQLQRRKIIDILKQCGPTSVEELSKRLGITSVTVRHHLEVLRSEGWVAEPVVRHRSKSGRPQHVYSLTRKADELFPRNYNGLALALLDEIKSRCDTREVNVIFEGAAVRLAADAPHPMPEEAVEARLERTIDFLNQKGYVAHWERRPDGYHIATCNCPFSCLVGSNPELCYMDLHFISSLTGTAVERVCHMVAGDSSCTYLLKAE